VAEAQLEAFGARLAEHEGRLHVAASLAEAQRRAGELIGDATVAAWEDDVLADVAAQPAAAQDAEVSLVAADAGVVQTGQIALVHHSGRARATDLLPERQIALLEASALCQTLSEALARLFADGAPGNVVLVAGPSRTADIEQRSIRGVHSPRELDVIVYSAQ